jgi:adenylate cyclase
METDSEPKLEIAHVLMIDVVGYSKLLLDEQSKVIAELNRIVRTSARFRVADVAGKLIRLPTGDGMALVFFSDPEAAIECAMEIATALKNYPEMKIRMGIHSGPVNRLVDVNESANVAGAGIDLTQRVMDCGDAGHILLSRRVAYDLAPSPRWNAHLYELGDCEVKHGQTISLANFYTSEVGNAEVPSKIKRARAEALVREKKRVLMRRLTAGAAIAFLLLAIGGGIFWWKRAMKFEASTFVAPAPDKSIAVLPFADLSQARDQEYFCDGMSEEILDALAKVEGLRVVARTSSFSFKGKNAEINEIARKLNATTVLEGSLRREGNRIRISAQLINARDGFHLWSETYERELQGVFAVQDEITRAIVDALKIKLAVTPSARGQQNTEAYDLYLQGLYLSNKSTEAELRASLDYFQRALNKDPKLGRACAGIGKDWVWLADAYVRPVDAYPKAEVALRKALEIDERDAEAHAYLSETKRIWSYDLKGEEAELKRALQIDPNLAIAHLFMGLSRTTLSDFDGGLAHIRKAVQLDPLSPIIGNFEVAAYVANDRLNDAFEAAKRTMEVDPNYIYFEPDLALVYREQGKLREALEIYQRLEQTRKQPTAGLAITYARLGKKNEARKVLEQLIQKSKSGYFPGEQIASVYVALDEREEAFRWLERAVEEHSGPIHAIAFTPEFRPLRSDPRFANLLRRIGLDPTKLSTR